MPETDRLLLSQTLCFSRAILNRTEADYVAEVGVRAYGALSEAGGLNCNTFSLLLRKGNVKVG